MFHALWTHGVEDLDAPDVVEKNKLALRFCHNKGGNPNDTKGTFSPSSPRLPGRTPGSRGIGEWSCIQILIFVS